MTRAVMEAYSEMIRENPKDYEAYLRRAGEYYRHNEYLRALDDVNKAILYTPSAETDMRFQAHTLRAGIYEMSHRYRQALDDLNQALELDPLSYPALYQRANVRFELGQYSDAKADYTRLQRFNARSQEALFGLARVAVKENNIGLANEYIEQAVALTPSQSEAYIRRASVKSLMNDYNGAVDDLLLALSTDGNNTKAISEIVSLANSNYAAVINGLTNAIRQAPRAGMFYYLRGTIAASHHHYVAAIADYEFIINEHLYNYAGIYASLAECHYALGNYEKASANIDTAISDYKDEGEHKNYYVIRSKILRATNDLARAESSVEKALLNDPAYTPALVEKALVLTGQKKAQEASDLLGEASINDPFDPSFYMLRAWVLNDFMNQQNSARKFYTRIADLDIDTDQVTSLYGFALLFSGKTAEATRWMEKCLSEPDYDGRNNYYGSCFYAWAGKPDKALDCMEKSLQNGYANYYNWTVNTDGRLNVAPLRDTERFQKLMSQYEGIFSTDN
ncbi:MAG: tetratricopeptide repeat protein [Muribaculaceae bacterium]|nr:tetratricopeptide repeat protein [Muribaculaceae bacterium]